MVSQLPLIGRGRRDIGPIERALAETLRQWRTREHLTGPENAARRALLRELARLGDDAVAAVARGDRTEFSAAAVVRMFREALDEYAPPPVAPLDPRQAELTAAAQAVIDSLPDDAD